MVGFDTPLSSNADSLTVKASVELNAKEPIGLRSTLLLAGLHFSWTTGGSRLFEDTFYFQKGEAIRFINDWLVDAPMRSSSAFMRLVALLSVVEVSRHRSFLRLTFHS